MNLFTPRRVLFSRSSAQHVIHVLEKELGGAYIFSNIDWTILRIGSKCYAEHYLTMINHKYIRIFFIIMHSAPDSMLLLILEENSCYPFWNDKIKKICKIFFWRDIRLASSETQGLSPFWVRSVWYNMV